MRALDRPKPILSKECGLLRVYLEGRKKNNYKHLPFQPRSKRKIISTHFEHYCVVFMARQQPMRAITPPKIRLYTKTLFNRQFYIKHLGNLGGLCLTLAVIKCSQKSQFLSHTGARRRLILTSDATVLHSSLLRSLLHCQQAATVRSPTSLPLIGSNLELR